MGRLGWANHRVPASIAGKQSHVSTTHDIMESKDDIPTQLAWAVVGSVGGDAPSRWWSHGFLQWSDRLHRWSNGFLIWKSRLASPEPWFRERRQLNATVTALVAATIPRSRDRGSRYPGTRADRIRPTPSDQFPLVERRQTEPTGRPRGEHSYSCGIVYLASMGGSPSMRPKKPRATRPSMVL